MSVIRIIRIIVLQKNYFGRPEPPKKRQTTFSKALLTNIDLYHHLQAVMLRCFLLSFFHVHLQSSAQQELCQSVNHRRQLMCVVSDLKLKVAPDLWTGFKPVKSCTRGQMNWKYNFRYNMLRLCAHTVSSRCLICIWCSWALSSVLLEL